MNETKKLGAPSGVGVDAGLPHKKMAILVAPLDVIRQLLFLPPGSQLIDLRVPFDNPGTLELKIEGAGWYTAEGCVITRVPNATVTMDENGAVKVDWNLPA